jgi:hypothetical protein
MCAVNRTSSYTLMGDAIASQNAMTPEQKHVARQTGSLLG